MEHLSTDDLEIIRRCLAAAVEGPFFPDWEFSTLFGLAREEVADVLHSWPNVNEHDRTVVVAVNNAIGNLIGYPHGEDATQYVSESAEQLLEVLERWRLVAESAS